MNEVSMGKVDQAIIRTGGKQYRVEPGMTLRVEKIPGEEGSKVDLSDVLLVGRGADVKIGQPTVSGASVSALIVKHGKAAKVMVYKFKRRKNYRRKRGHRQHYTELKIEGIKA